MQTKTISELETYAFERTPVRILERIEPVVISGDAIAIMREAKRINEDPYPYISERQMKAGM